MPRKRRPPSGESVINYLMSPDYDYDRHRETLRLVLDELQHALLTSRMKLEQHLRLFPEEDLREALERAEKQQERQLPLQFTDAFQAAKQSGEYVVTRPVTVEDVFAFLRHELQKRFFRGESLTSADLTMRYLIAELAAEEREVFAAIFLDTKHRPLALEKLFYGTIDSCSVHAQEVAKRALDWRASAVILAHNHPAGTLEPSSADRTITIRIRDSLALFDIRLLDHIIVGGAKAISLAEYGYI